MPDWAVKMMHNHSLPDEKIADMVSYLDESNGKFEQEMRDLAPSIEDRLRRFNV